MRLQHNPGLHDMQIMDARLVDARQNIGKKIGLLLVVALEADAVARTYDSFKNGFGILR